MKIMLYYIYEDKKIMKDPKDIIKRITEYPDETTTEISYKSFKFAQYNLERILNSYPHSIIEPIIHRDEKYWIVIRTPSWWARK